MTVLPPALHPLFWDCDPTRIDLVRHERYIVERLMTFTTPEAYRWLLASVSRERLRAVLASSRRVGGRDRTFWEWILADGAASKTRVGSSPPSQGSTVTVLNPRENDDAAS
jgi:hypothetical protein